MAIVSQDDHQVAGPAEQEYCVNQVFCIEELHDALVSTGVHGLVEQLEHIHPLHVKDGDVKHT